MNKLFISLCFILFSSYSFSQYSAKVTTSSGKTFGEGSVFLSTLDAEKWILDNENSFGQGYTYIVSDITQQKRDEERVLIERKESLESLKNGCPEVDVDFDSATTLSNVKVQLKSMRDGIKSCLLKIMRSIK